MAPIQSRSNKRMRWSMHGWSPRKVKRAPVWHHLGRVHPLHLGMHEKRSGIGSPSDICGRTI